MNVFRKRLRAEFGKKVYRHFVSLCKEELDQKKNKVPEEQIKANEKVVYSEMCEQLQSLTKEEIDEAYEKNTGVLIADEFEERRLDYNATPAVLCKNHGPFTWGKDAAEAVHNAVVLEEVAKMAKNTELLNPKVLPAPDCIKEKHFYRKHGANAYYGQN